MSKVDLKELLEYINPSLLNYQEWCNVGFALHHEGYSAQDWEDWSARDGARYHPGECYEKWKSFGEGTTKVTGATITQMAKENGWLPKSVFYDGEGDRELSWDEEIAIIDKRWVEDKELHEPRNWNPIEDLIKYLKAVFYDTEHVGYVVESFENKTGKHLPGNGVCDRTASQLIDVLQKCQKVEYALGTYDEVAGAWIHFNPLDGKGRKNANVIDYRYALIECDDESISRQNALIRELELPVAALVHSGNKSIHAIVKVNAANIDEYKKRVDFLYTVCQKNGLKIDQQNRNPSRLSRMPGIMRDGKKQWLIDTNIGKADWNEWKEWIDAINDDLPDFESLDDIWDNLPELAPPLIDGVLRQGHKMLIAGPSKAGKSFALIELCIAIAEGSKWLKWACTQGKVLYVNLELDRASCLHRFADVYKSAGLKPSNIRNIDMWNLRGKSIPMDKLAPKLIRRASKKNYIAIIIDPIYKVITGDENSADQMANFCNQFDKVCTELGCSVIYCHHHSKGSQVGKRSMDRASGSGVFARDPDALLDLIELEIPESIQEEYEVDVVANIVNRYSIQEDLDPVGSDEELYNISGLLQYARIKLKKHYEEIVKEVNEARVSAQARTAWRMEGTLREFAKFKPFDFWFEYPKHVLDLSGKLSKIKPEAEPKKPKEPKPKKTKEEQLEEAFEALDVNGSGYVNVDELADFLGVAKKTVRRWLKESDVYDISNNYISRNENDKN